MASVKKALTDTTGNTVYPITYADVVLMGDSMPSVYDQINIIENEIDNIIIGQNQEVIDARGGFANLNLRLNNSDTKFGSRLYEEENYILNSETITASLNKLDKQLKVPSDAVVTLSSTTSNLSSSLNSLTTITNNNSNSITAINSSIGTKTYTEQNYIANNEAIAASLNKIDVKLGDFNLDISNNTGSINTINSSISTINSNISTINTNIGNRTYTNQNYILNSESVTASLNKLDIQLKTTTDSASTASSNANTALSTANTASSNASTALSTANAALPKAGGTMTGNITMSNGTQSTIISQISTGIQLNSTQYGGAYRLPRIYAQTSETPPASMQDGDLLFVYTA